MENNKEREAAKAKLKEKLQALMNRIPNSPVYATEEQKLDFIKTLSSLTDTEVELLYEILNEGDSPLEPESENSNTENPETVSDMLPAILLDAIKDLVKENIRNYPVLNSASTDVSIAQEDDAITISLPYDGPSIALPLITFIAPIVGINGELTLEDSVKMVLAATAEVAEEIINNISKGLELAEKILSGSNPSVIINANDMHNEPDHDDDEPVERDIHSTNMGYGFVEED